MKFQKYHGAGNDFIVVENTNLTATKIAKLCADRTGIGSDGFINIENANDYYIMNYFNKDGSRASMCGNGLRVCAKYIYDQIVKNEKLTIKTDFGMHRCDIIDNNTVKVEMGKVNYLSQNIEKELINYQLEIDGTNYLITYYYMTTDHVVIDLSDRTYELELIVKIGKHLLNSKLFKKGTNTNFILEKNNYEAKIITFERGVGITKACGSGACAVANHLFINQANSNDCEYLINQEGGNVKIQITNGITYLTGPVKHVYKGEI